MIRLTATLDGKHLFEVEQGVMVFDGVMGGINAYMMALGLPEIAYRPFEDCAYLTTEVTFTSKQWRQPMDCNERRRLLRASRRLMDDEEREERLRSHAPFYDTFTPTSTQRWKTQNGPA